MSPPSEWEQYKVSQMENWEQYKAKPKTEELPKGWEFNPKTKQVEEKGLESPGLLDPVEMVSWGLSGGLTGLGLPAKQLAKRVADWGLLGFPGLAKSLYKVPGRFIEGLGAKGLEKAIPVEKAMPIRIGAEEIVKAPSVVTGVKGGVETIKPEAKVGGIKEPWEMTIDNLERIDFEKVPIRTVGYRYGDAPEGGKSFNTMTKQPEKGVSMASVSGQGEIGSFAVTGSKNRGKSYYEGDVIGRGGDDEPIMTNLRKITVEEYNTKIGSVESKKSALSLDVDRLRSSENLQKKGYGQSSQILERKKIVEKRHRDLVKQALSEGKPVPPEVLKDYPDLVKTGAKVEGVIKPLMEPTIKYEPHLEMAEAGTESMISKGIKRDPKKLMTEQLVEEWLSNPAKYEEISSKYGVSSKEFAGMMREQASSWGRKLGELGLEAKRLGKEIPELGEALAELEKISKTPGPMDAVQSYWKKLSNTWRGMLVTQLSTAMRNAEVQTGRVGLNVFEEGLNAGLQKVLGKPQTVHPLDGVEQLFRIFQKNKPLTERILKEFPKQHDRLFATYMSDIEAAGIGGKVYKGISTGVDILNTANRFQEYTIRRAVFMGKLDQGLKAQGMDLTKIIENNEIGKIPLDTIKSSVNKALEFTFAETPQWGTIGRKFTDFVTSMPGATLVMPFPRFLLNSLKFQFEYSPLGPLKLLSSSERVAFSAGNMEVISRATLGTAMFGVAYQIRNSEYAGEKWYELSVGGKTIDMRPYNPFVSYLFAADLVKKSKEGTLYKLTSKDIAMGVFSSNLRAGTGLYALDKILNGITETGDSEKAVNMIKQFGGEFASGFLTPLNQFKEFASGLDDYVVKEKRSEPFMGPIKEKIPGLEKTLPPLYSPTHEGPVVREKPAIRQATGLMMKDKNEFEKELDRLGFDYKEIQSSTGNPELDNLIARYMGIASQRVANPIMTTETYKNLDDKVKGLVLSELLKEIREGARETAKEEKPKLFGIIELEKIPRREKLLIKEPLSRAIEKLKEK